MTACWFDAERFEMACAAQGATWGRPLVAPESSHSTNDLALGAEREGSPEGATFLAREQLGGRGRRGSSWWSAPGETLTCSILLRPELAAEALAPLPLVVGLAVRELVARQLDGLEHAPAALIKWPNDVWIGSRKVCGVLVESRLRGALASAAVVGVGLNVGTLQFPEELAGRATSLARELRRPRRSGSAQAAPAPALPSLEELLAALLAGLERRYVRFVSEGLDGFLEELRACDALRGRSVQVEGHRGVAAGITRTGALRLIDAGGKEHFLHAGHVELIDP